MAEQRKRACKTVPPYVIVAYRARYANLKNSSRLKIELARKRVDEKTANAQKRLLEYI